MAVVVDQVGTGSKTALIRRLGLIAGASLGLGVIVWVQIATGPLVKSDKAYWQVQGPPCPSASVAALDRIGRPLSQAFDFEALHISRISGAVTCSGVSEHHWLASRHYDVCQFNSPRAIAVTAGGRQFAFVLDHARPATILVAKDGWARCVAAAHFKGE